MFLIQGAVHAQALRDINFNYLYNPDQPFKFSMRPVRGTTAWSVFYKLQLSDTTASSAEYRIQWELRTTLFEKEGIKLKNDSTLLQGKVAPPLSAGVQIVVARVTHKSAKQAWLFYQALDPKYPATAILTQGGEVVHHHYVKGNQPYTLTGEQLNTVSYYGNVFPAATPVFSESMGRVSAGIQVDSAYTLSENEPLTNLKEGLYLLQKDTNAAEGLSFRVQPDFPRYARIENLADPLIYICSKTEFDKIKAAKGDKKAFDRVILSITGDTERAKKFMRNYFRRVELANIYFSSYKEGWKTDRGMIYLIFGLPDQVFKFNDREVWIYRNDSFKISFDFTKSSTVFDPENYVLIREKKFRETWYEVIDLWRNARF